MSGVKQSSCYRWRQICYNYTVNRQNIIIVICQRSQVININFHLNNLMFLSSKREYTFYHHVPKITINIISQELLTLFVMKVPPLLKRYMTLCHGTINHFQSIFNFFYEISINEYRFQSTIWRHYNKITLNWTIFSKYISSQPSLFGATWFDVAKFYHQCHTMVIKPIWKS